MPSRSTIAHRPAPEHARRLDERRAAAGRRAVGRRACCTTPATAPRSSASRTSSRSSTRSPASPRTASPATGRSVRTAASSTSSRRPTAPPARCTTPAGWRPSTPRRSACSTRCSTARCEVNALGGGDTGAPQVHDNPIPREWYHTDWVADRTIAWLDSLDADDDWFCWMSFPDPHHPWDPPASEIGRVDWRDVPLPAGYISDAAEREAVLDAKPRHWRAWYDGTARLELRGAARLGAGDADRRPGARGQRPQRGRVRADRRGARPGARRDRGARLGRTTSTSSSPPTTASCRATSACCSRGRTTSTG